MNCFCLEKFESTYFKYSNSFFQNTQMRYFWSKILNVVVLHEALLFDSFESVNFKYENGLY